jgi:RimJ/RimL family protein N-acetyltransferase
VLAMNLRAADEFDAELLLIWRNDPQTRRMSIETAEIDREAHFKWLRASLKNPGRRLFIGEVERVPVGQVRLDEIEDGVWEISIALAPEARGKRLSLPLLLAGVSEARMLGARRVEAVLRPENAVSERLFRSAGFFGFELCIRNGVDLLACHKRL